MCKNRPFQKRPQPAITLLSRPWKACTAERTPTRHTKTHNYFRENLYVLVSPISVFFRAFFVVIPKMQQKINVYSSAVSRHFGVTFLGNPLEHVVWGCLSRTLEHIEISSAGTIEWVFLKRILLGGWNLMTLHKKILFCSRKLLDTSLPNWNLFPNQFSYTLVTVWQTDIRLPTITRGEKKINFFQFWKKILIFKEI